MQRLRSRSQLPALQPYRKCCLLHDFCPFRPFYIVQVQLHIGGSNLKNRTCLNTKHLPVDITVPTGAQLLCPVRPAFNGQRGQALRRATGTVTTAAFLLRTGGLQGSTRDTVGLQG